LEFQFFALFVSYVLSGTLPAGESFPCRKLLNQKVDTMIGLIPEQMFASAFQLACFCLATLTAVVSFLLVPRG
jgi:hypothetical protein